MLKIQNELKTKNPNYTITDLQKEMIKNKKQIAAFGENRQLFRQFHFMNQLNFLFLTLLEYDHSEHGHTFTVSYSLQNSSTK